MAGACLVPAREDAAQAPNGAWLLHTQMSSS